MARQPEYACNVCGRPFTRRWTTIRHINKKHDGTGEVETVMGYLVGTIQGKYSFPSYARPRGFPPSKKVKTKDYADSFFHNLAERTRDSAAIVNHFQQYRMLLSNPSFLSTIVADVDSIAGQICEKCHVCYTSIITTDGVRNVVEHKCDEEAVAKLQSLKELVRILDLLRIRKIDLPLLIMSVLDRWVAGQKLVSASTLEPSQAVESAAITRVDSHNEEHYVIRALKAKRQGQDAVPVTEAEVMDLIRKNMATSAAFEVDGAAYQGRYLIKILFPSQNQDAELFTMLEKKIRNDMQKFLEDLQKEEEELQAEEVNEQDVMTQKLDGSTVSVDPATPSGSRSGQQEQHEAKVQPATQQNPRPQEDRSDGGQ